MNFTLPNDNYAIIYLDPMGQESWLGWKVERCLDYLSLAPEAYYSSPF